MTAHEVDKKLEGRLFDLLEREARIRLGELVQLRRRSRARGMTLLHAAVEAGLVQAPLSDSIARAAGLTSASAPAAAEATDEFDALPRLGSSDGDVLDDSLLDSVVDPLDPEQLDHSVETDLRGFDAFEETPPPARVPSGPPPLSHDASGERPIPLLRAPPQAARPVRATKAEDPFAPPPAVAAPRERSTVPVASPVGRVGQGRIGDRPTRQLAPPVGAGRPPRRSAPPVSTPPPHPSHGAAPPPAVAPTWDGFPALRPPPVHPHAVTDPPPTLAPTPGPPSLHGMPQTTQVAARTEPKTELMASPRDTEAVGPDHDTPWRGDTAPPTTGEDATPALEAMLPHLTAAADRYAVGRELGRGGMGHVLEAQDVALDRPVALKLLNEPEDSSLCLRFVDEARVTGQLQHPGVPPVYDLGTLGDGRLFFAMKRIEGRTLREVIEDLREDGPEARNFGRVRLLTVFSQICRAIAYAHSRGVMHRDLKPDNIMLGAFGEVTVMDWGLAKPFDGPDRPAAVATRRGSEGRFATQAGEVTGTPHYMPPEQAAGRIDELGPHSDIYSLGAVLYELLTLEPPFDGPTARAIRDAVATQPVTPPSRRAPDRDIPHDAEQLCLECLSKEPAARPRSAAWVADQVDQILEGDRDRARKAEERDQQLERGQRAADNYFERVEQHRLLHARTAKLRARIDPWADDETRRPLWQAEDAEAAARLAAARSLSEALAAYHAALGVDGDHFPTRRALCALYYAAFEAAERDGDAVQMAHYENFVRAYDDDETYAERIEGDGALEIETSPKGLTGTLFTYAPVDRVLTPTSPRRLERLPAVVEPLAMGSYLLKLRGPGLTETPVPLHLARQQRVRLRVRLFPDAVVGQGFVHVVGGPARLGGDPRAQLAQPASTVEVGDFFVARRPVTSESWLAFLYDLQRTEGAAAARARIPRAGAKGPPLWPIDDQGVPALPDRDEQGTPWRPEWPVVNISCADAEAYCAWLTARTGHEHRLPTEEEWEKAARGADGRLFPWGDQWEPTVCHLGISREGAPRRGPAGAFPTDRSPFGVEDLAGGVSEWTASWLDEGATQRVIKGGHWASGPTECRAASRFTQPVDQVLPTLGFRVVRSAPT